jgi:putative nucleotidyltransferase with HDIG domain
MALDAERIVNNVLKVASLPAVALKFSEAIRNPLTSNQELETIISEDTALASKILMIANSALFNFPSRIDTISKAITIIGFKQLNEIIMSCSIIAMFKDIPQEVINMEQFWRHNIAVATTGRILASFRREQNVERFFTAGLLHDIGKLVLFVDKPSYAYEVMQRCSETNELMHKVEKEILGFDHASLGAMLLKKWKLPDSLVSAVYYHHMPSITTGDIVEPAIVHVADIISHAMQFGTSGENFVPTLNEKAWAALGLDVDVISNVIEQLGVQYKEAVKYILGEV